MVERGDKVRGNTEASGNNEGKGNESAFDRSSIAVPSIHFLKTIQPLMTPVSLIWINLHADSQNEKRIK